MTLDQILKIVEKRQKGSFMRVLFKSKPTLTAAAKKEGYDVEKFTEATLVTGISYANIEAVKTMLHNEGREIQSRTWGTPMKGHEEFIIEHNGKYYLKLYMRKTYSPVQYFICNGEKITKDELKNKKIIIDSYWKEHENENVVMTANVENIISIKGEEI